MKLDALLTIASILSIVGTLYDQHQARRRARIADENERRIRDLEERIARLERDREGPPR